MVRLIFKLRIARVVGANHPAVSFDDPGLEKARQAAQAAAPVPVNKAALEYITERNSKRDRFPIFHSTGCGSRRTCGQEGLNVVRRDRKGSVSGNGVVGCSSARPALACDTTEYRCVERDPRTSLEAEEKPED